MQRREADTEAGDVDGRDAEQDRRVFLGWDRGPEDPSLLQRAAHWIAHDFVDARARGERTVGAQGPDGVPHSGDAADLGDVRVALPGGRALRHLRDRLAEAAAARHAAEPGFLARWQPPSLTTAGHLPDELVALPRPTAGTLVRTLAWARALMTVEPDALKSVVRDRPAPDDFAGWLGLGGVLRDLHARLAPEGLDFADVTLRVAAEGGPREGRRWKALAAVQQRYRRVLADLGTDGLDDPHEARRAAIARGDVDRSRSVLVVGVLELGGIGRAALATPGLDVTPLVFAPTDAAGLYTPLGEADTAAWAQQHVPLRDEHWVLADRPADQAARAVELLAQLGDGRRPDEITLGVPDEEVVPHLERRLVEVGVASRTATGTALAATPAGRLLEAAAVWLRSRRFPEFAALVRHPDVEVRLGNPHARDAAGDCDEYATRHLPGSLAGPLHGAPRRREPVEALRAALDTLFGELASDERRPPRLWVPAVGALLEAVYAEPLDRSDEGDRRTCEALEVFAAVLEGLEALPPELDDVARITAADALQLVLRESAGKALTPAADEGAVELLGWLELLLDEAQVLVLTGFQDGRVPERVAGDGFLSERFGRSLGLPGEAERTARDACALTTLLHSRPGARLVTGRRSQEGEPLTPSRLLFHTGPELAARRMVAFVEAGKPPAVSDLAGAAEPDWVLPVKAEAPPGVWPDAGDVPSLAVTAFRDWLESPYTFYLRHVGPRIEAVDDDLAELDARLFGTLAHEVLESLWGSPVADSTDADAVEAFLRETLTRRVRELFGRRPLPAVALQREQLGLRLAAFARWHAGQAGAGWRLHAVEWQPSGAAWAAAGLTPPAAAPHSTPLDVDGRPVALKGKIDRIDVNPGLGAWRVLDYKTGESGDKPTGKHRSPRTGEWRDLQLPLYVLLAEELRDELAALGIRGRPRAGYVVLPRKLADTGAHLAEWDEDDLADAWETAREAVRGMRAGRFFVTGARPSRDECLAEIEGAGLLADVVPPPGAPGR